MEDTTLLELKNKIKDLENKDASHIAGFMTVYKIFVTAYEAAGTELQKCFIQYLTEDLERIYKIKSEHGRFNHVIK